jgi:hypothetical protein
MIYFPYERRCYRCGRRIEKGTVCEPTCAAVIKVNKPEFTDEELILLKKYMWCYEHKNHELTAEEDEAGLKIYEKIVWYLAHKGILK